VTHDVLAKLPLLGKDHDAYSLETVTMFHRDAVAAGYSIPEEPGVIVRPKTGSARKEETK